MHDTPSSRAVELKKHVGAIHVKGSMTLLQRKIANVLLLNAYEELPDPHVTSHSIQMRTLAKGAGFDSKDTEMLKNALEALVALQIRWNVLDVNGEEEWGVSAFLGDATIKRGLCEYSYPPTLRERLYNPEVYARINLQVQERFGSMYSLALYENCVRFRRVGSTGWIELEKWRDLLGVEDGLYSEFKYLKRDVLKPAIREVNRFSDIAVEMELKRERRRVVALRFRVRENPQLRLGLARSQDAEAEILGGRRDAAGPTSTADVEARLQLFGLTAAQCRDVVAQFPAARIDANLAYVERELEAGGTVKNVPAYALAAIRDDFAAARPVIAEVVEQRKEARQEDARRSAEAEKRAAVQRQTEARRRQTAAVAARRAQWADLDPDVRARVDAEAVRRLRQLLPFVHAQYEKARIEGVPEEAMPVAARTTLEELRAEVLAEEASEVGVRRAAG